MIDPNQLTYDEKGLVTAVVQTPGGEVRMVGHMNAEAVERTLEGGWVTFWSRSRQCLWTKGLSSGNRLRLISLHPDCDADALLVVAEPEGPTVEGLFRDGGGFSTLMLWVAFMTCPTKNPSMAVFPALYCSACLGLPSIAALAANSIAFASVT